MRRTPDLFLHIAAMCLAGLLAGLWGRLEAQQNSACLVQIAV